MVPKDSWDVLVVLQAQLEEEVLFASAYQTLGIKVVSTS
jgi:hypothetical protein